MYTTLLERFQGALGGCAIADAKPASTPSLSATLMQQGQLIERIPRDALNPVLDLATLTDGLILSLLCHDDAQTRQQCLIASPPGLRLLSHIIAARLQGLMPPADPPLMQTIDQAISQRLPLQAVAPILRSFPDSCPIEQTIGLAIYCWRCTPQHFTIAVPRAQRILTLYPDQDWIALVPALTGLMVGVSVGRASLPRPDTGPMQQAANRLYGLWAGLSPAALNPEMLNEIVIAQAGQLKPRHPQHRSLQRDYE